jgi:hypothetical protein
MGIPIPPTMSGHLNLDRARRRLTEVIFQPARAPTDFAWRRVKPFLIGVQPCDEAGDRLVSAGAK